MAETAKQQELYHVIRAQLIPSSYSVEDLSPVTGLPTFRMHPPILISLIKTIPHCHCQELT